MTAGADARVRSEAPSGSGPRWAVGALFFLAVVTAAWWALALWPSAGATPAWLARTRLVCFDAGPDGLPGPSGWLLLIGQPIGMVAVLVVVWGAPLRAGLRALARPAWGRALLGASALGLGLGAAAATDRVADAVALREPWLASDAALPDTYPRLDRPAPEISLRDQHGQTVDLASLRGGPALVTFAFGSCETVCPAVVKQVLEARDAVRSAGGAVPRVVIVSLDPWRDTPSRLGHLAHHWQLDDDAHVVSGSVEAVEAVLDGWNVARERDPKTGDVTHPPLVYVLDAAGRIAFASTGGRAALVQLLERTSIERPGPTALAGGGS